MIARPPAVTPPPLAQQQARLAAILHELGSVCVGYSGGVDSVFLATTAVATLGRGRVLAVTGRSASYPEVQWRQALDCVQRFGIPHLEIDTDELADPRYAANPADRCYYCKTELWSKLRIVAAERGMAAIVDGSNADDASDHRPGGRAGAEHGVRSPLLEAGLTKADIRALSRAAGLPTWDRPASPCLASRLPYGLAVTPARLRAVEAAEHALCALGFAEFRVRHHGDAARIELAPTELEPAIAQAATIAVRLRAAGFARVLLDIEGYRRGALNESVVLVQLAAGRRGLGAAAAIALALDAHAPIAVAALGHDRDVLAVAAPGTLVPALRAHAQRLKACGFRYIALELGTAPTG